MILLFAFLGGSLCGQSEEPVIDPEPLDPERTIDQNTPQDRNAVEQQPLRDTVPWSDGRLDSEINVVDDSVMMSAGKTKEEEISRAEVDHSPKKAMTYALIFPGLGQAYNKKYFKIPFVYGAFGGVGYWVYYNTNGYRQASSIYAEDQSDLNERILRYWRRQLELSYITIVATYALQVLDAYVDAHLLNWDVNPDLSIRLEPTIEPFYLPVGVPASNYGITCKLTF